MGRFGAGASLTPEPDDKAIHPRANSFPPATPARPERSAPPDQLLRHAVGHHVGSVVSYLKGPRGEVPPYVLLPKPIGRTGGNLPHGHSAGYLGRNHDPFILNADPNTPNFKVPDLLPPDHISTIRAERRQRLRAAVDAAVTRFESDAQAKQLDESFQRAYQLMSSPKAREAFALDKEPHAIRDRYGRTRFGQSCLLARRLIEAGVRFVTVNMFETVFDEITWDIHGSRPFTDIEEMAKLVAPNFDQAFSALLEDLEQRGLLQNTVVTAVGEFGRTPKINDKIGRDHWEHCYCALLAGGGFRSGLVYGESDDRGERPRAHPCTPADLHATILAALGITPEAARNLNLPVEGQVLDAILA